MALRLKNKMYIIMHKSVESPAPPLACEQAHLVCYSHDYLGGGAATRKWESEANRQEDWARKSEPA